MDQGKIWIYSEKFIRIKSQLKKNLEDFPKK